jgi:hypothetical protein
MFHVAAPEPRTLCVGHDRTSGGTAGAWIMAIRAYRGFRQLDPVEKRTTQFPVNFVEAPAFATPVSPCLQLGQRLTRGSSHSSPGMGWDRNTGFSHFGMTSVHP